jgi:hypothetical protein
MLGWPWWPLSPRRSVLRDWVGALPQQQMDTYKCVTQRWNSLYGMGSVALEGAYEMRRTSNIRAATEQASVAAQLLNRLADDLVHSIEIMHDEARHLAQVPAVEPIEPTDFRSPSVRWSISVSRLLHQVTFSERARFFNKLRTLDRTVEVLSEEFLSSIETIAERNSQQIVALWRDFERLHDDLNTCLRESEVVLKCFLRAVRSETASKIAVRLEKPPAPRIRPVRQPIQVSV